MLERLLIFLLIILLPVLILKLLKKAGTSRKINFSLLSAEGISIDKSRPSLIYFWSDYCAPCVFQSKIFYKLKEKYDNVNFISLNAVEQKELTSGFSIKTVPSIALFTSKKEIKFLKQGFADEEELKKELDDIY